MGERELEETNLAVARLAELTGKYALIACGSAYGPLQAGGLPTNRFHLFEGGKVLALFEGLPDAQDRIDP